MSSATSLREVDASNNTSERESVIEQPRASFSANLSPPPTASRPGTGSQKDKRKSILSFTGSGRTVVPDEPKLFDPEKLSLEDYLREQLRRYVFFIFNVSD